MLKVFSVIVLFSIGQLWALGLSCDSCGDECAPACGTRRFRICCFNHLKRKRVPEQPQIDELEGGEDFVEDKPILIIQKPDQWIKKFVLSFNTFATEVKTEALTPVIQWSGQLV